MADFEFPRVELPNATEEDKADIKALHEEMEWAERTGMGYLAVIMARCKPFTGKPKPPRRPTKHQRHMAKVAARSHYLKIEKADS